MRIYNLLEYKCSLNCFVHIERQELQFQLPLLMAVAGGPAGPALAGPVLEERMHRNALSLSIEYTTGDTYNSDQLSMIWFCIGE